MRENVKLKRHNICLYPGDFEALQALSPDLGAAILIRRIVRKFLREVETNSNTGLDLLEHNDE